MRVHTDRENMQMIVIGLSQSDMQVCMGEET